MMPSSQRFNLGEIIVYPSYGVGEIVDVEQKEIVGYCLELFVIAFKKNNMVLRVPITKTKEVGMRKLSDVDLVERSLNLLLSPPKGRKKIWSRRAQEYETKINSGDLIALAEVLRDLYSALKDNEQSYSEKQLYDSALERVCSEITYVKNIAESEALSLVHSYLDHSVVELSQ